MITILLGNPLETVTLVAENFIWGKMTFSSKDSEFSFDQKKLNAFKSNFEIWAKLYQSDPRPAEFMELTEQLYSGILFYRLHGLLKGLMEDKDNEQRQAKMKTEILENRIINDIKNESRINAEGIQ